MDAYNHTPHASLGGKSPSDRFFPEPEQIHRLDADAPGKAFLLEIDRTVSADSVVVIGHTEYQADCRFAKRRIKLRYSPDLSDIFIVEADGTLTPVRLLDKHASSTAKREKTYLGRRDS